MLYREFVVLFRPQDVNGKSDWCLFEGSGQHRRPCYSPSILRQPMGSWV